MLFVFEFFEVCLFFQFIKNKSSSLYLLSSKLFSLTVNGNKMIYGVKLIHLATRVYCIFVVVVKIKYIFVVLFWFWILFFFFLTIFRVTKFKLGKFTCLRQPQFCSILRVFYCIVRVYGPS